MARINYRECNFDGIVGPTHNYAGLAYGNTASMKHGLHPSNPREAALQSLAKMRMLMQLGIPQAILPPHERPYIPVLRRIGFSGSNTNILTQAHRSAPQLLAASCSAASMWTANAANVTPSCDSEDQHVHLSAANLCSQAHRSIEAKTTERILRNIFADDRFFTHHTPLPSGLTFADEGAANHTRFSAQYGAKGIHLFAYGRSALARNQLPHQFPARQTLEASQAIVRLHQMDPTRVLFAQQLPEAIDAGVFHNDVISVGNENFFFYHEHAFVNTAQVVKDLKEMMQRHCHRDLVCYKVTKEALPLEEAVKTYLFNSQIVTTATDTMALIAPQEAQESEAAQRVITNLLASNTPVKTVHYVNLRQSMHNGGGPACVRLRIVLSDAELQAMHQGVLLTDPLYEQLVQWVTKHYRDRLHPDDLADSHLLDESRSALDELTVILGLGPVYDFQL